MLRQKCHDVQSHPSFEAMCSVFSVRSEEVSRQFPSDKGCSSVDKQLQLHTLVPTSQ